MLIESSDLAASLDASLDGLATSDDPIDSWFRGHVRRVLGFDLAADMHLPEPILDALLTSGRTV